MAKTMQQTTTRTTAQAYAERTREIDTLMKRIRTRLDRHRKHFESTGSRDWGYVGDLANFAASLEEIDATLRTHGSAAR
jgi:hypothetical protein